MSEPSSLPPAGLCESCRWAEVLSSPRSRFLFCRRSEREPEFPRYPPLPVLACRGWEPVDERSARLPPR